jgi:hypothetical protein
MPSFLVLRIYLLLSDDDEGTGWNHFLYGGSFEDEDDNYGVSNFTSMTIWKLFFLDGDIKAEMMSVPIIFSGLFSVLVWLDLATMKI